MEFELVERLRGEDKEDDSDGGITQDHRALRNQSSVDPEDYPDREDRALQIPEEERD